MPSNAFSRLTRRRLTPCVFKNRYHIIGMAIRPDLEAYIVRIGVTGRLPPTIATLDRIVAAHVAAIPFENIASFTGCAVDLLPDAVAQKLVHSRRGGYCFEQNGLLMRSLTALGYTVRGLMARVAWGGPEDAITPRSHMLLLVGAQDGERLADVGFGGMTPTGTLRLEPDIEQEMPLETCRLTQAGDDWRLQALVGDDWRLLYRFDLSAVFEPDFELANWHASTHPKSIFVVGLVAARAMADRRLALHNGSFAIHHAEGPTDRRQLADAAAVLAILDREFHIDVPDPAALGKRLAPLL